MTSVANPTDAGVGNQIFQTISGVGTATGYIASYDSSTKVLKYYQDRSLYYNDNSFDQKDSKTVVDESTKVAFSKDGGTITSTNTFSGAIDVSYTGITTTISATKKVNLATQFTEGVALPEINKGSGEIIYLDNRPRVSRNPRQKEDIKIILEF